MKHKAGNSIIMRGNITSCNRQEERDDKKRAEDESTLYNYIKILFNYIIISRQIATARVFFK